MIYVIGDTHFNHDNIIGFCQRPFYDIYHMNERLVSSWNNVVFSDDLVIHVGDFSFGRPPLIREFVERLSGFKLLIMGNHDRLSPTRYKAFGFDEVCKKKNYVIDNFIFSHRPIMSHELEYGMYNIHGHVHDKYQFHYDAVRFNVSCEAIDYTPIAFDYIKYVARYGIK